MKTVALRLKGGLGNKLFIYSFGEYIKQEFRLNIIYLSDDTSNKSLEGRLDFQNSSRALIKYRTFKKIDHLNSRYKIEFVRILTKKLISKSEGIEALEELNRISNSKFPSLFTFDGYYQDFSYYDSLILKPSFSNNNPTIWFKETEKLANELKPIVLHIRLGDYLTNLNWNGGVLSSGYYIKALNYIRKILPYNPIWIFSNDFNGAKSILQDFSDHNLHFVEASADKPPFEVLEIMSKGHAIVISNSTFSLWAAKLSTNAELVLFPNPFLQNNVNTPKNFPKTWKGLHSHWL